jgi:hypothetical protein
LQHMDYNPASPRRDWRRRDDPHEPQAPREPSQWRPRPPGRVG